MLCVAVMLMAAMLSPALAQGYSVKLFNEENGLEETFIYTINQDDKGFLWLGTGAGLLRFDGASFKKFTTEDGLSEDFTTISFADHDGGLWFGHFEGGLSRLVGLELKPAIDPDLLHSSITGISQDSRGNLWLASQRNGLVCIDSTNRTVSFEKPFDEHLIFSFMITEEDKMLIGTDEGLKVYTIGADGNPKFSHEADKVPLTKIAVIRKRYRRPGYWLGTEDEGLVEFVPGSSAESDEANVFNAANGFPVDNIQSIYEDKEERVWVGTFGESFLKFNDKDVTNRLIPIQQVEGSDTVGKHIVRDIYQDKFGQMWMGTYGEGLLCIAQETFSTITLKGDSSIKKINTTLESSTGDLWFGTDRGLFKVDPRVAEDFGGQYTIGTDIPFRYMQRFTSADGLTSNEITALHEDKNGVLWVGTRENGMCKLDSTKTGFEPISFEGISTSQSI
ncbi:MAG: two-component regulator propeller domain-containing protein, partial [Bacteroidota bacterium]